MYKYNDSQLTQQCQHYENELRKEDQAVQSDDSDPQLVKHRDRDNLNRPSSSSAASVEKCNISPQCSINSGSDRRSVMRRRQMEAEKYRQTLQRKDSNDTIQNDGSQHGTKNGTSTTYNGSSTSTIPNGAINSTNGYGSTNGTIPNGTGLYGTNGTSHVEQNNNDVYKKEEDRINSNGMTTTTTTKMIIPPAPPLPAQISPSSSNGMDEKENIEVRVF